MIDDRITTALEKLPRQQAGADFTAGVMRRLDHRPPSFFSVRWALTAATTAIVLLGLGLGWREWQHHRTSQADQARLERLMDEKRALVEELHSLRRIAEKARPVLYLGGHENVDLVLDLARLQRRGGLHSAIEGSPGSASPGSASPTVRSADLPAERRFALRNVVY